MLRCESAAEKYAWLARLKYVSETPASERPVRKYSSRDFTEGGRPEKRGEGKRDGRPPKVGTTPESAASRASPAYLTRRFLPQGPSPLQSSPSTPHVEAAMGGIGSTVLFEEDSRIGPEPMSYGLFEGEDARGFDGFLAQLAQDTAAYVRTVCNTIVITVPKAIIHCQVSRLPLAQALPSAVRLHRVRAPQHGRVQVKRAETHLLEELYGHMTNLSSLEQDTLLDEEPDTMQRRAAINQVAALPAALGAPSSQPFLSISCETGEAVGCRLSRTWAWALPVSSRSWKRARSRSTTSPPRCSRWRAWQSWPPATFERILAHFMETTPPQPSEVHDRSKLALKQAEIPLNRLTPAARADAGQNGVSRGPPARSSSSGSTAQPPRRPSLNTTGTPSPRVQVPASPSGPPNLSSPSPMPRRKPPAPPPGESSR